MGDFRQLSECRLGRQDGQATINLEGIRADNLAAELFSQTEGKRGFADPGGAGNDHGFRRNHGNENLQGTTESGCCSLVRFRNALGSSLCGGFTTLRTLTAAFGHSLGAADDHLAPHVFLVMKLGDGALGFLDGGKLHEAEALGSMGVAVGDDLDILNGSHTAEELQQIAFGGIKGEIAYINTGSGHLDTLRLAGLTGHEPFGTVSTRGAGGFGLRRFLGSTETDGREQLGKETLLLGWLGWGVFTAGTIFATVATTGTVGGGA